MSETRWILTQWENIPFSSFKTIFVAVWDNKPTEAEINGVLECFLNKDSMANLLKKGNSNVVGSIAYRSWTLSKAEVGKSYL